jgi:hypothetical protein
MTTFAGVKLGSIPNAFYSSTKESRSIDSVFKHNIQLTTIDDPNDDEFIARELRASQFARALQRMDAENFVLDLPPHNQVLTTVPYKVPPRIRPLELSFETVVDKEYPQKWELTYSNAQMEEADNFLQFE